MAPQKRKRRKKTVKYRDVSLKLSPNQKRSLLNYCEARRTTPTKLIKKMIRPFIQNFAREVPEEFCRAARQLELF
jgi:hypothetical protein